jgi:gamma-glutamyltranspeptidase
MLIEVILDCGAVMRVLRRAGDLPAAAARVQRVLAMAGAETPANIGTGEPTFAPPPVEWGDTVHIDVVDRFGNMLAATPSGGWLQSSPAVPGSASRSRPADRWAGSRRVTPQACALARGRERR